MQHECDMGSAPTYTTSKLAGVYNLVDGQWISCKMKWLRIHLFVTIFASFWRCG